MSRFPLAGWVCLVVSCSLLTGGAIAADQPETIRIRLADVEGALVDVPQWSANSPQRLVRLSGALHQREGEFLYPVVPDTVTVRLADDVQSWDELVDRALSSNATTFAALKDLTERSMNRLRIVDLKTSAGANLPALCELIEKTGLVRYAEVSTFGTYTLTPNDTRYSEQWALNNTGQTGGTPGADMRAEEAWDLTTGDPSVQVAVIDSGSEVDHEDLVDNVWFNDDEVPNNGVDDDANGYVDDYEGWDFNNNNNDPRSTNSHGTQVAGMVAATTNNGIGVSGLAGGFGDGGVRFMALGVGDGGPNGSVLDDAIIYATDNGAAVITMSLSVGESQAINDALVYAYETNDVFVDCAAGNNGSSVSYPARRPQVMSVASSTHNDTKSGFSNPGPENEITAPGSSILSTTLNDGYGSGSGTSFAAPHVAALAGLVRGRNPGLSAPEVRQLLIDSSVDIEDPGFDNGTGWGRIDAFEAVSLAANSNGIIRLDGEGYSCSATIGITVSDIDLAGTGTTTATVTSGTEPGGEVVTLTETGASSGVFRGTILTSTGPAAANGILELGHAETVTAEYVDADDGEGGTNVSKIDTAVADCVSPIISEIGAVDIDENSARIVWTTDESSTSVVRYGPTPPPTDEASAGGFVTSHSVNLTGLESCTIYKYEVESVDALGNVVVDDNGGQYYTFETYGDFPDVGVIPCHQGQVQLDQTAYGCADVVAITVTDIDLNADVNSVETVDVLMTSTTEPDGETITLTEIDADNSRFEGSIALAVGTAIADGALQIAPGDLITASYFDDDDGEGRTRTSTYTSDADCVAPGISDVQVTQLSNTRAVVTWTTDEPATSRMEYGTSAALGSVVENLGFVTSHSLTISGYDACDRVYFRVESTDAHGDTRTTDAGGAPFEFNTSEIGGLVFYDGFESDLSWDLDGDWERGASQGLGSANGDPSAAFSGGSVLGNDLSGAGSFPGDYEPGVTVNASTPIFSAVGEQNLELIFRRKLGVEASDSARVQLFTAGVAPIWTSSGRVNQNNWSVERHDISNADGQPSVRIVFQLEADGAGQSFGWNIDELIVKDASQPDYVACSNCSGAASFGGVTRATDVDACAAGGIQLEWDASPAWGSGSGGTYEVHRGTSAGFVPDATNRIASGISGTSYTDADAPVDQPVWYVVRARNNESCGPDGGLSDVNSVRLSATETISQPLAQSPGNSLSVGRVGAAHARLTWGAAADAHHYVVRRSENKDFSDAQELGQPANTLFEDQDALTNAKTYFYAVVSANACGDETP